MASRVVHDRDLFEALLGRVRATEPEVRGGAMFGSPAAFAGSRMAFCVFERSVGLKLPEARARELIAAGEAVPFQPFGKAPMREWIQMTPRGDGATLVPFLREAVAFALSNPKRSPAKTKP